VRAASTIPNEERSFARRPMDRDAVEAPQTYAT
jgi:hypothetical protein